MQFEIISGYRGLSEEASNAFDALLILAAFRTLEPLKIHRLDQVRRDREAGLTDQVWSVGEVVVQFEIISGYRGLSEEASNAFDALLKNTCKIELSSPLDRVQVPEPFYKPGFSAAIIWRSRWGSVRRWPAPSSHLTPGGAPQVGQRIASMSLEVTSFFITGR